MMGQTTEISWAHSTFNPWIGCTNVSPGCDHCYAEALDKRWGHDRCGPGKPRQRTSAANWKQPLAWNRKAKESGEPWRVFCASLADVFDNEARDDWRHELFSLIEETPALTWMLLTKRIGNVRDMTPSHWMKSVGGVWPRNVWLGITVVNQEEADRDIRKLLRVPAAVHWLSCEPLLGPIDLPSCYVSPCVDWVIVGGESGHGARLMRPEWARSLRDQCAELGVPFHFKQWGGLRPKSNGHLLDGAEHRAFPDTALSTGT